MILSEVGCTLENLVDITVFLKEISDYNDFNKVWLLLYGNWKFAMFRFTIDISIRKQAPQEPRLQLKHFLESHC